jgi:hypothetical protein
VTQLKPDFWFHRRAKKSGTESATDPMTRRSRVQIPPPLPPKNPCIARVFRLLGSLANWLFDGSIAGAFITEAGMGYRFDSPSEQMVRAERTLVPVLTARSREGDGTAHW